VCKLGAARMIAGGSVALEFDSSWISIEGPLIEPILGGAFGESSVK